MVRRPVGRAASAQQNGTVLDATVAAKTELRRVAIAARAALTAEDREAARTAVLGHVLARWEAERWRTVAGYVPLRSEPGSAELLTALRRRGVRVLVPITLPDRDLDWAEWNGDGHGPGLGVNTVSAADVVLTPARAVARDGTRLGRGGGSYDRALARVARTTPRVALLFDGELLDALPAAPWDVAMTAVVTPSGWVALE